MLPHHHSSSSLQLVQWCSCTALLLYPTSLKRPMISPIEKKPMVSAVTMPTCVKAPESRFLSRSRNDCGLLIAWSAVFSAALAVRDPRLAGLDTAFRSGAMADWTVWALLDEKLVRFSTNTCCSAALTVAACHVQSIQSCRVHQQPFRSIQRVE